MIKVLYRTIITHYLPLYSLMPRSMPLCIVESNLLYLWNLILFSALVLCFQFMSHLQLLLPLLSNGLQLQRYLHCWQLCPRYFESCFLKDCIQCFLCWDYEMSINWSFSVKRLGILVSHFLTYNVDSKQGMMIKFAENIANFAASSGKKHIIVLSSLDFQRLHNLDMSR